MAKAAAAPVPALSCVQQIGQTAGEVWASLDKHGPMSLAKLVERVGGNRDVVMQAIGWLAREDKLEMSETKRGRVIALKAE
jgi:hypothetical protein